jgi:transposase InsO family protein
MSRTCSAKERRTRKRRRNVVTLRCTRLVRDRLQLPRQAVPESPPSTGRLGDWYVHLVRFGRPEFAIATSERSLLTVLFPARALRTTLAPNLRAAVGSLLESLGVSGEAVAREIAGMESVTFGRTTNRRIFSAELDRSIAALGFTVLKSAPHTSQMDAVCERVIGTIRRECLDWLIPVSEPHLRRTLRSWVKHYNRGRPHMALGPGIPDRPHT